MDLSTRFRINYPNVVASAFGDEWVIVNLESGTYFSLEGSASLLWPIISSSNSIESVIVTLHTSIGVPVDIAVRDVSNFCDELIQHDLITETSEISETPITNLVYGREYFTPVIAVHADLQDILLLDPVHDVEEGGWPKPNESSKSD